MVGFSELLKGVKGKLIMSVLAHSWQFGNEYLDGLVAASSVIFADYITVLGTDVSLSDLLSLL